MLASSFRRIAAHSKRFWFRLRTLRVHQTTFARSGGPQRRQLGHYSPQTPRAAILRPAAARHAQAAIYSRPRRGIVHLPILGALGGKLFAALALKKVAVAAIIRRLGVKGTIDQLHTINESLLEKGLCSKASHQAAKASIDSLETALADVQESEQAQRVWEWMDSFKSKNPTLIEAVAQTYLEGFSTYKWAKTLMTSTSTSGRVSERAGATGETLDAGDSAVEEDKVAEALITEAYARVPGLQDYYIVLVRKETSGDGDSSAPASET